MVKHRPSRCRVWAECTTTAQGSDAVFDLCVQGAPESGNRNIVLDIIYTNIIIFTLIEWETWRLTDSMRVL